MSEDVTLAKSGQYHIFVQADGSSPDAPYLFVGCMSLGGIQSDLGAGEPIYCPSSSVPGQFDIVDTTAPPPALPTTDFTQHMSRLLNDFWWDLRKRRCKFNMKIKGSNCARPDNPDDFEGMILTTGTELTAFNTGAFNTLDADAAIDLTGTLQMRAFDKFVPIKGGEVADSAVFSEALDGIYADTVQCGDCGNPSDGCQRAYVLTTTIAASPALASQLVYTLDGGNTWDYDNIDSLATQAANKLAQVGNRIVVISEVDESHSYKRQSVIDSGTAAGWTTITTGYVASKGPLAIWSLSPTKTYISAEGGYIYFLSNPTSAVTVLLDGSATVQDLVDIRGKGRTIVAVGDSNALVASFNGGETWTLITGPAVGIDLTTVEVVTSRIWFVGTNNGKTFYTTDQGATWTEVNADATITKVNCIRFVDEIVGYMSVEIAGGSRIYRTADNGATWFNEDPYISGVPAADRYNFVTPCPENYNTLLAGGLSTGSTDGILALAVG